MSKASSVAAREAARKGQTVVAGSRHDALPDREALLSAILETSPDGLITIDESGALEAILMIADEPQSIVSLATALGAPVPAVRQSIERLVDDYDGRGVDGRAGERAGQEERE